MTTSDERDGVVAVAVLSTAETVLREETTRSLEEMIFETTSAAISAAGLELSDIDDIVLSGNDEIDGRVISCMPSAGPAGGVGRDATMIASSADHGLVYAFLRVRAGQGRRILVTGWAKPSESVDADRAELMEAEPYLLRNIGMNHTIAAALQASLWADGGGTATETIAWPLSRADLPARGDSVYAAVLAVEGSFPVGSEIGWIIDAGWTTLSYELGSRDLSVLGSLSGAVAQIEKRTPEAGPKNWSSVEVAADSEPAVARVASTLGLADSTVVNGSGRLREALTSPHVAGMARMIAAIKSLDPSNATRSYAAGIGFNGYASQGATVVVFSNQKAGALA